MVTARSLPITSLHDATAQGKSLKTSFIDGIFSSGMFGFTQDYFTPFLLLLGATGTHIGFLNAIPNLCASLAQLKSADAVQARQSRKQVITFYVFLQALTLIPMAFMAGLKILRPWMFIALVTLFLVCGAFSTPAWGSLMSDLVPEEKRGAYFGWRMKVIGFVTVVYAFIAGIILQAAHKKDPFLGFVIVFGLAFVFRMISRYYLGRLYEQPLEFRQQDQFTFIQFLRRIRQSNFARFSLFVATMSFSVNLAAPFFAMFMLRELGFNYILYSALTLSATLTLNLMFGRWGRLADHTGNLKVIKLTAPLLGTVPLLWLINRNPFFLFFAQVYSGFLWAGFNLCSSNFIYDAVTPEKRTRCIAYFNVLNGVALCVGSLLGGFLIPHLPALFGYQVLALFLISSLLRILAGLLLPGFISEVRPVTKYRKYQLFASIIGIRPLLGGERKILRL